MTRPTVDTVLAHIGPVTDAAGKAAQAAAEHAQAATEAITAPEPHTAAGDQQGPGNGR